MIFRYDLIVDRRVVSFITILFKIRRKKTIFVLILYA